MHKGPATSPALMLHHVPTSSGASVSAWTSERRPSARRPSSAWTCASTSDHPFSRLFSLQAWFFSVEGVRAADPPVDRRVWRVCGPPTLYTASDRLVKLKSRTLSGGITTAPPASVPATRIGRPSISRLLSMNSGDSLKRRLRIALAIFPFSMRKVPSRVRPVYSTVRGSTSRRYHSLVTRMPRGVERIISSIDAVPPSIFTELGKPVGVVLFFCAQNRE